MDQQTTLPVTDTLVLQTLAMGTSDSHLEPDQARTEATTKRRNSDGTDSESSENSAYGTGTESLEEDEQHTLKQPPPVPPVNLLEGDDDDDIPPYPPPPPPPFPCYDPTEVPECYFMASSVLRNGDNVLSEKRQQNSVGDECDGVIVSEHKRVVEIGDDLETVPKIPNGLSPAGGVYLLSDGSEEKRDIVLSDSSIDEVFVQCDGKGEEEEGEEGLKVPKRERLEPSCSSQDPDQDDFFFDFLGKSTDEAEARLAARRQARAEAREIRMRELERQQKDPEENADRYDYGDSLGTRGIRATSNTPRSTHLSGSSRRSSEDSTDEGGLSLRDVRHELKEMEEKFKKAMVHSAQLDNEKASLTYQVELLKDKMEDLEEAHSQLQREHKDKCREYDQLKRDATKLKEDMECYKAQLEERDTLIQEYGLVIVGGDEEGSSSEDESEESDDAEPKKRKRHLVTAESAQLLQNSGEGSLDVRLRRFVEERNELQDQISHLKLELEEERNRGRAEKRRSGAANVQPNGPDNERLDVQRETSKQVGDYKFKLQKAEQEIATLQANVARLETQVFRYKSSAEAAEKVEDELKVEKRKLQRELREALSHVEELETSNSHLQKRLDKLKNAKSALLKEL